MNILQIFGFLFLTVGVYSMNEKDVFNNLNKTSNLMLDPAFLLICIGSIIFIIGFTGSAAALRENTFLLSLVIVIIIIFLFHFFFMNSYILVWMVFSNFTCHGDDIWNFSIYFER